MYFPGIDSTANVYYDHDGFYQHLCNVNGASDCSSYFPVIYKSPLLPLLTPYVHSNAEVIKQTIFEHEAIFRSQVMELHRLYDKQRELMNEMRNDFIRGNTQVRLASSGYGLLEQKQTSVVSLSPSYFSPFVTSKPLQLQVGKNVHSDRSMHQVECSSRQCESYVKCKKYNNKVLDLQLLATEYMDDEDDACSVVGEATHPVRTTSSFSETNDEHVDQQKMLSGLDIQEKGQMLSGLDIQEKRPRRESSSARPILFDLNEPFSLEGETLTMCDEELLLQDLSRNTTQSVGCLSLGDTDKSVPESISKSHNVSNHEKEVSNNCEAGQISSDSNPLNQESNYNCCLGSAASLSLKSKRCDKHLRVDHRRNSSSKKRTLKSRKPKVYPTFHENNIRDTLFAVPEVLQFVSASNTTETHLKPMFSPAQSMLDFRRNPIAVQALPCVNQAVLMKKKKSKPFLTATDPDRDRPLKKKYLLNPTVDCVKKPTNGKKGRRNLRYRNVNQDSYRLEPLSPENEECSPPRGESDENLMDTQHCFYAAENGNAETNVVRIAAKAILFLSADAVRVNRSSLFESLLAFPENPLRWFAEVASVESQKESMCHNSDDFETMTLKLKEWNTEEQYCSSIIAGQDEKPTSVTTATRARGKRSKKLKDFQGVVLPRISSLLKHEVTEDLQLIEDLMVATGTPNNFISKKRSVCSRGRKQSSRTASAVSENSRTSCLPLDLKNKSSEWEGRPMMIDWGKISKRRRGQRYPARKLTFSQLAIASTLKAH